MIPAWRGEAAYRVSRSVRIEGGVPTPRTESYTSNAVEKLVMTAAPSGASVSLAFDSSIVGLVASAKYSDGTLSIAAESTAIGAACDVRSAVLNSDLADVAAIYPNALVVGMQWADSLDNITCISGFPGRVTSHRRFRVETDTTIAGSHAVIVARRDTISATAEGLLDRHQATVGAEGNALARIYIATDTGQPVLVEKGLTLTIAVKTATRAGSFVERSASSLRLVSGH